MKEAAALPANERAALQAQVPYNIEIERCHKPDNDMVGELLCRRAEHLGACGLVMASHCKGLLTEMFVGSVTKFAVHHSKVPLFVLREACLHLGK